MRSFLHKGFRRNCLHTEKGAFFCMQGLVFKGKIATILLFISNFLWSDPNSVGR
jgi:hypothetical protein